MGQGSPPPRTWSTVKCRHVRCLHYGFSMCGGFTVHMYIYCSCSTCTLHTTRVPFVPHVYPAHNTCTARVVSPTDNTHHCRMKVSALVHTCLHTTRVRLHACDACAGDCRPRCSCWSRDPCRHRGSTAALSLPRPGPLSRCLTVQGAGAG